MLLSCHPYPSSRAEPAPETSFDSRRRSATGPLCANWIAQKVSWQWVYWVQLISGFVCWILCVFFFPETRGDVILKKRCARLEKQTGKHHFVHGLDVHESWGEAFKVSCSRPLIYLVRAVRWRGTKWASADHVRPLAVHRTHRHLARPLGRVRLGNGLVSPGHHAQSL
jgi:hypothetical protein